jgi:exodeoxyribonuclease VII large subunit
MIDQPCLSILELNDLIKASLEHNPILNDVWITGEITQFKHYAKANQYYLNISDGNAVINCVMYSRTLSLLTFEPTLGQQVFIRGKVTFFKNRGSLIFQIAYMTPDGIGKEIKKLAELKALFKKEGFFDPEKKRALPLYPETIGLITSLDSAAMGDFMTTLRHDNHYSTVLVIPTTMQGSQGVLSISESIDLAIYNHCDMIAIVRGGGSAHDLSIFNDENLCRKIHNAKVPVITGIGHQTDESLADLVADVTTVTPTACAHYLTLPFQKIKRRLKEIQVFYDHAISSKITQTHQTIIHANHLLRQTIESILTTYETRIAYLSDLIVKINPLTTLSKGYSITTLDGKPIRSIANLSKDAMIRTSCVDGTIDSIIKDLYHAKKSPKKH